jgi:signal transduction histidine kinase/CheY-like chemotaxis protein
VRVPTEADGVKWLEIFATRREGGSTDFATSSRDVTERVEIESRLLQSQKLEAIGQLTGGVAHDFNNLLTVIMGNIQLLSRNLQCDQKTATHLERIMGAAKSGSQLTRSLLTFSRQQVLDTSDVDIDDVLHGMKELLSRTMGDNIEIAIATCDRPCYGHTDKHQLESAVLNMCINARDAMPNGGRLTLESRPAILDEHYAATHASVLPGRYIEIAVTDTGTGMPPDILEHIFEPFFTTKSENKGTGLGLSTIYGFMKQSGGHVAAYSEPGQGTTFKLYVPVGNAAGVSEETRPGGEKKSNAEIKGLALVVEDDESVREIAIDVLSSIGLRVIDAHDAADGIEKFRQNPEIAIVFSDIVMPGDMTGVDLANTIREMSPDVPIVLASGYAEQASRRNNGIPHGVKFLAKPYDIGVLETLVKEMLETGNGRDGPRKVQH